MGLAGLRGKRAIVTGGARGIGLATAARLVEEGCRTLIVDLDQELVDAAVRELGAAAVGIAADVSTEAGVDSYMEAADRELGGVDLVHLNAGIEGRIALFAELDPTDFDKIQAVNVRGVYLGLRAALPPRRHEPPDAIVITASLAALRGELAFGAYVASKHAVVGLMRTAALEAAPRTRVNAVAPGSIQTRMMDAIAAARAPGQEDRFRDDIAHGIPLGRYGTPAEIAATVAWLLSEESSFVTGALLSVDGGVSIL